MLFFSFSASNFHRSLLSFAAVVTFRTSFDWIRETRGEGDDACKFEFEFAHKFHRQRIFSSPSLRFCLGFLRFAQFVRIFPSNLIIISSSAEVLRPRSFILSSLTRIAVRSIFPPFLHSSSSGFQPSVSNPLANIPLCFVSAVRSPMRENS